MSKPIIRLNEKHQERIEGIGEKECGRNVELVV